MRKLALSALVSFLLCMSAPYARAQQVEMLSPTQFAQISTWGFFTFDEVARYNADLRNAEDALAQGIENGNIYTKALYAFAHARALHRALHNRALRFEREMDGSRSNVLTPAQQTEFAFLGQIAGNRNAATIEFGNLIDVHLQTRCGGTTVEMCLERVANLKALVDKLKEDSAEARDLHKKIVVVVGQRSAH